VTVSPSEIDGAGPADGEELVFPLRPNACFGCGPDNPVGLGMRFFRDGVGIRSEVAIAARHRGACGVVHGGIQAVVLDETCCAAAFFTTGRYVVTGELRVRYHRPCPVGERLRTRARIVTDAGKYLVIGAEMRNDDEAIIRATAAGRFFPERRRATP
jgi:uncharacterized protein (TIGR00369 family)